MAAGGLSVGGGAAGRCQTSTPESPERKLSLEGCHSLHAHYCPPGVALPPSQSFRRHIYIYSDKRANIFQCSVDAFMVVNSDHDYRFYYSNFVR